MANCRCCLKQTGNLRDIFEGGEKYYDELTSISDMLNIFKNIKISKNDRLSKSICITCLSQLSLCYSLYSQIQASEKLFLKQPQDNNCRLKSLRPRVKETTYQCSKCNQKVNDLENHMNTFHSKPNRLYKCSECIQTFISGYRLIIHRKTHSYDNICKFCNCYFKDKTAMKDHIEDHQENTFYCMKCSETFSSRRRLLMHIKKKHNINIFIFYCNGCEDTNEFIGREELEKHIEEAHEITKNVNNLQNTPVLHRNISNDEELIMDEEFLDEFLHSKDEFHLNKCWDDIILEFDNNNELQYDDGNKDTISLNSVTKSIDTNTARYKCPRCNINLHSQKDLKRHLAHDHNEYVLICNSCGLSFNRLESLKSHRLLHVNRNVLTDTNNLSTEADKLQCDDRVNVNSYPQNRMQCTVCSKLFTSQRKLQIHEKTVHCNEIIECTLCHKSFKTRLGLKYHVKTHAGIKNFSCPFCSKQFVADINLNNHIRTMHAVIKPHVCNLCDNRFATLDHLKKHVMSIHQKERNHLCNICGKGFAQRSHLTQHLSTHLKENLFECDKCAKKYFKYCNLQKHIKKYHTSNLISLFS